MKLCKLVLGVTCGVILSSTSGTLATEVGVRSLNIPSASRGGDLKLRIWYPAEHGGTPVAMGENRIFKGAQAFEDAPLVAGIRPLVLFSHGSGGNVEAMGWLANALVKAGFIVAGPNHPGTTSGNSLPEETPKVWQRVGDLSAVIDFMQEDAEWKLHIDADRIGAVGFSLGGTTVMKMAGARTGLDDYARYCDSYKKWDCAWYANGIGFRDNEEVKVGPFDLRKVDRHLFEQSDRDPRLRTAVLVDPGMARSYVTDSLEQTDIPMNFINLGSEGTVPLATEASHLAELTPDGSYVSVQESDHFSFLPECKQDAEAFLESINEPDPICVPTKRARGDIHAELSNVISALLQVTLKNTAKPQN